MDMVSHTQPLSRNRACGDLYGNCQMHTFIEGSSLFVYVCPVLPGDSFHFIKIGTLFALKAAVELQWPLGSFLRPESPPTTLSHVLWVLFSPAMQVTF